ncbi:hypothetical protein FJW07_30975 [Mesorhizobium sp. B3-1-9]|uniref:hypothetical protein n=1 Tax=Mesorhizobium sp. B3-1-9 TaxID=2589892 RepID=UPI00112CF915|nr:hypothetical protein [Mesorhizobium sp. B3-1-9]TPI28419.1 hypothetical protein FJW07_30975 [Mesorhizobium sp. B3-1-9]
MTLSRRRSPAPVAIAAALVLFVQAFVSGAGIGAQAAAGPRDAFGNILCTADAGTTSHGGSHSGGYDCDCCLSGCDFATAIIPEANSVEPLLSAFLITSDSKRFSDAVVRRYELQPLSSRGPPDWKPAEATVAGSLLDLDQSPIQFGPA